MIDGVLHLFAKGGNSWLSWFVSICLTYIQCRVRGLQHLVTSIATSLKARRTPPISICTSKHNQIDKENKGTSQDRMKENERNTGTNQTSTAYSKKHGKSKMEAEIDTLNTVWYCTVDCRTTKHISTRITIQIHWEVHPWCKVSNDGATCSNKNGACKCCSSFRELRGLRKNISLDRYANLCPAVSGALLSFLSGKIMSNVYWMYVVFACLCVFARICGFLMLSSWLPVVPHKAVAEVSK